MLTIQQWRVGGVVLRQIFSNKLLDQHVNQVIQWLNHLGSHAARSEMAHPGSLQFRGAGTNPPGKRVVYTRSARAIDQPSGTLRTLERHGLVYRFPGFRKAVELV